MLRRAWGAGRAACAPPGPARPACPTSVAPRFSMAEILCPAGGVLGHRGQGRPGARGHAVLPPPCNPVGRLCRPAPTLQLLLPTRPPRPPRKSISYWCSGFMYCGDRSMSSAVRRPASRGPKPPAMVVGRWRSPIVLRVRTAVHRALSPHTHARALTCCLQCPTACLPAAPVASPYWPTAAATGGAPRCARSPAAGFAGHAQLLAWLLTLTNRGRSRPVQARSVLLREAPPFCKTHSPTNSAACFQTALLHAWVATPPAPAAPCAASAGGVLFLAPFQLHTAAPRPPPIGPCTGPLGPWQRRWQHQHQHQHPRHPRLPRRAASF